jgi:hypothetical protein
MAVLDLKAEEMFHMHCLVLNAFRGSEVQRWTAALVPRYLTHGIPFVNDGLESGVIGGFAGQTKQELAAWITIANT